MFFYESARKQGHRQLVPIGPEIKGN
jgi:hypothetical protein